MKLLNAVYVLCSGEFMPRLSANEDLPLDCVGSWSCWYGEQDQFGE